MLEKLIEWASSEDNIRTALLSGSRAVNQFDEFSDYDIALFATAFEKYTRDESWLLVFGKPWVVVHEKVPLEGREFPTRLVIFDGGAKIDFSFFSADVLSEFIHKCGDYQILVDKDQLAHNITKPSFDMSKKKPSQQEFLNTVNEFWFEAYHVAISLKRGDLWTAKFRASIANEFLLRVIEWNAFAKSHGHLGIKYNGKQMQSWIDKNTWQKISGIYAHFDATDSWKALKNCMNLFREISTETARLMAYTYPQNVELNMTSFINHLHQE